MRTAFMVFLLVALGTSNAHANEKEWKALLSCIDKHAATLVQIRRPDLTEITSATRSMCRAQIETWCAAHGVDLNQMVNCYSSPVIWDHAMQRLVLLEGQFQAAGL